MTSRQKEKGEGKERERERGGGLGGGGGGGGESKGGGDRGVRSSAYDPIILKEGAGFDLCNCNLPGLVLSPRLSVTKQILLQGWIPSGKKSVKVPEL